MQVSPLCTARTQAPVLRNQGVPLIVWQIETPSRHGAGIHQICWQCSIVHAANVPESRTTEFNSSSNLPTLPSENHSVVRRVNGA